MCFGPVRPDFHYTAWKVCNLLGWGVRDDSVVRPQDIRFAFEDETHSDPVPGAINGGCTDISKSRVDTAMARAFGYCAEVDPTTHSGRCVRKSEENTAHDGVIIDCPAEREAGYVYQRVIDNEVGGEVEDLRLVKVGDRFAVGYRKYRAIPNRFVNANTRVVMMAPTDAFDEEQLSKLLAAADDIGLDVGEIDVLRDAEDGRIYMIDVNKTPWGPPGGISVPDGKHATRLVAAAFERYASQREATEPVAGHAPAARTAP